MSLPAGLTSVTVTNGGTYNASTGIVTFSFATPLAKGFSQTNAISYAVPSGAATFAAAATVSTTTAETVRTNNTAAVTTTVVPSADVTVTVSGPTSAFVGGPATYVVTTTNNGLSTAASVAPTLQLAAGLTNNGATVTVTGGGSYDNASGLVTFTGATILPNGASLSNTVRVTVPDVSQLNAVARVSTATLETNLDNNYASTSTIVTAATATTTDLRVASLTSSAATVNSGANVTLTAIFANNGGATATAVAPGLALPAGLTNATVSNGGSYNVTTGLVTWPVVSSVTSGTNVAGTYTVSFAAPASGTVTGTATISSADLTDPTPANNTLATTVSIMAQADPATSISGPAVAQPGASVTYAVSTTNNGPALASSTQRVTLPAGEQYQLPYWQHHQRKHSYVPSHRRSSLPALPAS